MVISRGGTGPTVRRPVGLFLRADDFDQAFDCLVQAGVVIVSESRRDPYGTVALYVNIARQQLGSPLKDVATAAGYSCPVGSERVNPLATVAGWNPVSL